MDETWYEKKTRYKSVFWTFASLKSIQKYKFFNISLVNWVTISLKYIKKNISSADSSVKSLWTNPVKQWSNNVYLWVDFLWNVVKSAPCSGVESNSVCWTAADKSVQTVKYYSNEIFFFYHRTFCRKIIFLSTQSV